MMVLWAATGLADPFAGANGLNLQGCQPGSDRVEATWLARNVTMMLGAIPAW